MTTRSEAMELSLHGDLSVFHACAGPIGLLLGQPYTFRIKPWETPLGEVIQGEEEERFYLGYGVMNGIAFFRVQRDGGKVHLIAEETIEEVLGFGYRLDVGVFQDAIAENQA